MDVSGVNDATYRIGDGLIFDGSGDYAEPPWMYRLVVDEAIALWARWDVINSFSHV